MVLTSLGIRTLIWIISVLIGTVAVFITLATKSHDPSSIKNRNRALFKGIHSTS